MCGCTHTVVRITAAVYEALKPILKEMREDIISEMKSDIVAMKNEIATISQSVSNQTEEVNTRLSGLNESLRDDFSGVERELSSTANIIIMAMKNEIGTLRNYTEEVNTRLTGLNESLRGNISGVERELSSTANIIIMAMKNEIGTLRNYTEEVNTRLTGLNESLRGNISGVESMISDKIEEHDNQITTQLMRMNQTLTKEIFYNTEKTCGGTWGWRRAVYLDMTDPNTNCPSGWQLTGYSKRTCGRATSGWNTCDSVFFPVSGGPYSQVCGRIRAYQHGTPEAFSGYNHHGQTTIDSAYVSGVAVMYGSPRQHIWAFANGAWENYATSHGAICPCDIGGENNMIPPFVGEDYFCESGYIRGSGTAHTLHSNDILWDGRDCHSTSTCCSLHNPPYFTKTLNQTTTDDLELRICLYNPLYQSSYDNIAVELVELYVK